MRTSINLQLKAAGLEMHDLFVDVRRQRIRTWGTAKSNQRTFLNFISLELICNNGTLSEDFSLECKCNTMTVVQESVAIGDRLQGL